MSKSEDYRDEKGSFVWRTVGGRRIKIYDGQSLSDAMKASGKFKSAKKKDINKMGPQEFDKEAELEKKIAEVKERFRKGEPLTKEELKEKYGTDNVDIINAGKEKEDRVSVKEKLTDSDEDKEIKGRMKELQREIDSGRNGKDKTERLKEELQQYKDKYEIESEKTQGQQYEDYKRAKYGYRFEDEKKDAYSDNPDKRPIPDDRGGRIDPRTGERFFGKTKEEEKFESIKSQQSDIEKASGLKVEKAWETDLYGNGKEDRFKLEDGRWIAHSTESMGKKEDSWSINKVENGSIESQDFKSYDDMIKHLGGSSKSDQSTSIKLLNDYKKQYFSQGSNTIRIRSEVEKTLDEMPVGTQLGQNYTENISGWTSHGGYSDSRAEVLEYTKNEDGTWKTKYGTKTSREMVNSVIHNEGEMKTLQQAKADRENLSKNNVSERRNIINVGTDSAGNKVGRSTITKSYPNENSNKYAEYYKKENLGEPSNYQKGDKIEFNDGYYNTIKGSIVREATDQEKKYQINSNLKGYVVRDENGFEHIVADTKIKNRGGTNKAYKSAYEEYKKKHPNTKLSFGQFVDMSEGK